MAAQRSSTAQEPSVEASSTPITSCTTGWASTARTAASSVAASLYTGITTATQGPSAARADAAARPEKAGAGRRLAFSADRESFAFIRFGLQPGVSKARPNPASGNRARCWQETEVPLSFVDMSGSRRAFFRHAALAGAGVLGCPAIVRSATTAATAPDARPRHLIHLVADGTSIGTLTLGDHFSRLHRKTGLRWLDLCRQPAAHTALVNMRSLNSWVTDSAAASSSWSTGSRVVNGVLNQLPDGTNLRPLCSLAAEAGWKRGLVTTTEITHATPAGFAANTDNRGTAEHIALQYLERKIDVLLGGGRKYFEPTRRKDKRDLHAEFARAGYSVLQTASQLAAAPRGQPCLGTFASGHLPFTIDHQASDELRKTVPTLADMTNSSWPPVTMWTSNHGGENFTGYNQAYSDGRVQWHNVTEFPSSYPFADASYMMGSEWIRFYWVERL